jgi:hypothetical protein
MIWSSRERNRSCSLVSRRSRGRIANPPLDQREQEESRKARARRASLPGRNRAQRGSRPRGCTDFYAATASTREIAHRADEEA